jgi:hypothetical protein
MRILSVRQLKPIVAFGGGNVFPLTHQTKIILDKKSPASRKTHQLIFQQGSHYGTVGDFCTYLSNKDLLELEAKGVISIKKAGVKDNG